MSDRGPADVLVAGSINVDLVVRVDRLPGPSQTVVGGVLERHGGGKGGNQAVAAARWGARVRFIGAVGRDDFGTAALAELAAEGIDTDAVAILPDASTGVALIVVDRSGENQIAVASGANERVDAAAVRGALEGVPLARDGVCLLNLEIPDDAVLAAAMAGAAMGLRTVLNPAPARALTDELLGLQPILTPNAGEAEALTGLADPSAAAHALAARTRAPVVVTLGAAGALVVAAGVEEIVPAIPVAVVDTTGAGDTFNGVLAAELARGSALTAAVRLATAAASRSVTFSGAREGMPTPAEVAALHATSR